MSEYLVVEGFFPCSSSEMSGDDAKAFPLPLLPPAEA